MNESTRRRALESTARVALGCYLGAAALGACGGQSVSERAVDGDAQPAQTDPDPAATATPPPSATTPPPEPPPPPVPPTPTLACLEPINVVGTELATPFADDQKACCESYVEGLVSAGMAPPARDAPVDPSLLNCCRAFAYSTLWKTTVTHTTCCSGTVLSGLDFNQPYCSPWGPQVPPALVAA